MFRSALLLSKQSGRTIVRDPRKRKLPAISKPASPVEVEQPGGSQRQPLPFSPGGNQQQTVGSSLGFYALAGAGMAIGFSLVGALFGGF